MVEVLSLKIKNNPHRYITGKTVFNHHKTHAQYANDIWAIIKNDQKSFYLLMKVFQDFCNFERVQCGIHLWH